MDEKIDTLKKALSLPFLTRHMFPWGNRTAYQIKISVWGDNTGPLELIGITKEGPFKFSFAVQALGTEETFTFAIPDIPIFLTIKAPTTTDVRGVYYIVAYLQADGTDVIKLLSGYPSYGTGISWPTDQPEDELRGKVQPDSTTGSNPAAGDETSYTPYSGHIQIIKAVYLRLVTDANVANRRVNLLVPLHGSSTKIKIPAVDVQAASLTYDYYFIPTSNMPTSALNNCIFTPIPDNMMIFGTQTLITSTDNIQAGDDFGSIRVYYDYFRKI